MNVPCVDRAIGDAVRSSCDCFSTVYRTAMSLPIDSPERNLLFRILGDIHTCEVLLSCALSDLRNYPPRDDGEGDGE